MKRFWWLAIFIPQLLLAWDQGYRSYDSLLNEYVSEGLVDYQGLKGRPDKLLQFIAQIEHLEQTQFDKFTSPQKLAFWINAFNAYTLQLVIDHYPVKSIRGIPTPWKKKVASLFGQRLSLDDIEHQIIRKEFNEPRIHFALVCAAKGCPILQDYAYTPENLDHQLKAAARQFLLDSSRNDLTPDHKNVIRISMLFKWYGKDFQQEQKTLINFIEDMAGRIYEKPPQVKYLDYDWGLNEKRAEE